MLRSTQGRCVEVTGSHVGLIFNRLACRAIAEALALLVGTLRWAYRVLAYYHLMTDAYPPF